MNSLWTPDGEHSVNPEQEAMSSEFSELSEELSLIHISEPTRPY